MIQNPENPSAGKFDPPSPHNDPMAQPPLYKRWWFSALMLCAWLAHFWLRTHKQRGWMAAVSLVLLVALTVSHAILNRIHKDERDDRGPYSPPSELTR